MLLFCCNGKDDGQKCILFFFFDQAKIHPYQYNKTKALALGPPLIQYDLVLMILSVKTLSK